MKPRHYWQIHQRVWNADFDNLEPRFQAKVTEDQLSDEYLAFSAMVMAKTEAIFVDPEHRWNNEYRWKVTPERRQRRRAKR